MNTAKPIRRLSPDYMGGRVPPQAPDLECAVLGAAMLEPPALHTVLDLLRPEHFYVEANCLVFEAVQALNDRHDPVDILTVTQELRTAGTLDAAGGSHYVASLANAVASGANTEVHCRIVVQKFLGREMVRLGHEAASEAMKDEQDVFDLLAENTEAFMRLNEVAGGKAVTADEVARQVVDDTAPDPALRTGFEELDRVLRLEVGVNIVGARPGQGKTAFAISLAWRAAQAGTPVYFASLEMGAASLVNRLICGECAVPVWKAKRKEHSMAEKERMAAWYINNAEAIGRIVIDDTAALDTASLAARAARAIRVNGVGLVIVDYLQLLNVRGEKFKDRFSRVTAVSERLRIIAKEAGVPVLALSQLNRSSVQGGKPRRPSMSDLRESGQIEQDADTIMLLHREAYYDPEAPNNVEVIIAKNRDGADGLVVLGFDAQGARVVDHTAQPPGVRVATVPGGSDDLPF